jgi:hypothetical protein
VAASCSSKNVFSPFVADLNNSSYTSFSNSEVKRKSIIIKIQLIPLRFSFRLYLLDYFASCSYLRLKQKKKKEKKKKTKYNNSCKHDHKHVLKTKIKVHETIAFTNCTHSKIAFLKEHTWKLLLNK